MNTRDRAEGAVTGGGLGAIALFAAAWFALSFAGLVAIYWISTNPLTNHLYNSSDRTIDALAGARDALHGRGFTCPRIYCAA